VEYFKMDPSMATAIAVLIFAGLLVILASSFVIWQNRGSINLVLAYSTLCGTAFFFAIQLFFQLQGQTTDTSVFIAEYTIDRGAPAVYRASPRMGPVATMRQVGESAASTWLAKTSPFQFKDSNSDSRLGTDLAIFSLVYFIGTQELDWQQRKIVFRGSRGTATAIQPTSESSDRTILTERDIASLLSKCGNIFAGASLLPISKLYLPPHSHLAITRDTVSIANPICEISFHAQFPSEDYSQGSNLVQIAIETKTRFLSLRAHNPTIERYKDWTTRLLADAEEWWRI
jgi:hypothetical protein